MKFDGVPIEAIDPFKAIEHMGEMDFPEPFVLGIDGYSLYLIEWSDRVHREQEFQASVELSYEQ